MSSIVFNAMRKYFKGKVIKIIQVKKDWVNICNIFTQSRFCHTNE